MSKFGDSKTAEDKPATHRNRAQHFHMSTPHVGLFAEEVLDTEVAIRMQDRPHSRSLNPASLPISHIGNRRLVDPRSRAGEGDEEKRRKIGRSDFAPLSPSFLEIEDTSVAGRG